MLFNYGFCERHSLRNVVSGVTSVSFNLENEHLINKK